jgi:RNA polymerase sigma-70 factor (ECF subfamily)
MALVCRQIGCVQESNSTFAALWEAHVPGVRRQLTRYGVAAADVDDLVQDVFLLTHKKRALLSTIQQVDPWLREVCRRVAAGYRRRAHRRREIAFGEPPEPAGEASAFESALERAQDEERLHQALGQLDEKSRELVALHALAELALNDIATLVKVDRKTVRKRLSAALRRLSLILCSNARVQRGNQRPRASG